MENQSQISETFFATEALQSLEKILQGPLEKSQPLTARTARHCIDLLKNSVKFRLPDNGNIIAGFRSNSRLLSDDIGKYCPDLRLPFPITLLEYGMERRGKDCGESKDSSNYDAIIILAFEETQGLDRALCAYSLFRTVYAGEKWWVPVNFGVVFDPKGNASVHPVTDEALLLDKDPKVAINDIKGEASTIVEFLSAMACSNSEIVSEPSGREKINKKRERSGRPPFYSYKVLKITQGSAECSNSLGGTHSSPRVHLRRGHIRRLKDRIVWVNSAVVGDKSKGFVAKDYAVAAQA